MIDSVLVESVKPSQIKKIASGIDSLTLLDVYSPIQNLDNFAKDVLLGLKADKKFLSPKYFYDQKGSELFVQITKTDEYYPTRTEREIINQFSPDIIKKCENVEQLIELGSGNSEKTDILLKNFHEKRNKIDYIMIDVSDIIIESGKELLKKYDRLSVTGILSDYTRGLTLVPKIGNKAKLILFLGSSIGNFEPHEIEKFLVLTRQNLNQEDFILVGFDLVKDRKILHAAYNDTKGITKAFNLNILRRINRELEANFDLNKFEHHAFYNENRSRIEMHLVSKENQMVTIDALKIKIYFKKNESIHTENSYKFTHKMIHSYAGMANLNIIKTWTDPANYFALCLMRQNRKNICA